MALSEDFLLELKQRNDIESVVSSYVGIKRGGRNPKGLCPFHNEKTPSFTLYPENGSFYCFGCGKGGDVIQFIRLIENLDYIDAVKFLADRSGMQMPQEGYDDSAAKLKRTLYAVNRETARFFHAALKSPTGDGAYRYLRSRGLTDSTIVHFGLGYAPDSWSDLCDHLRKKGYTDEQMLTAGVAFKSRNGKVLDRFRARTMFPILDVRGNVIAFGGRRMKEEDTAKYINTADTPVFKKSHNVYALNFAKNNASNGLILCEGYMDVIALHQAGFENAVAPLGTAFTEEQALLLSRYTGEVVVTMDADGAGQKATHRVLGILNRTGVKSRVISIPDGKDPDEFIKKNGQEGPTKFRALLQGAANDTEYRLFCAAQGLDLTVDRDRVAYLEKAAALLAALSSPVEADVYAGRIATQCGIDKQTLLDAVKKQAAKLRRTQQQKQVKAAVAVPRTDGVNPKRPQFARAANAEEGLLGVLIRNPDFVGKLMDYIDADAFLTDFNRKVYFELVRRYKDNASFDLSVMGGTFTAEELGRLARIQALGQLRDNSLEECGACYQVMKEEQLKATLATSGGDGDEDYIIKMTQLAKNKNKGATEQ